MNTYVKRKQNHQGSYTSRRAAAIRPMINSTQGIATLLCEAQHNSVYWDKAIMLMMGTKMA